MNKLITCFTILLSQAFLFGQTLQSPESFLGYSLGTYFSRHHQVVDYFNQLELNGDGMVQVEQYGKTNENRPLLSVYISSKKNIDRLEKIKSAHELGESEDVAIVWLSYNVHGNESSGTEAAMLTAYELITEHTDWLDQVLIIMDPCLNPDGRDRYVNWYNQKKNLQFDPQLKSLEHDEPWPSGRFNHYLSDLNRDWAWLKQVESQQRIALFNKWNPHVHVDFHEQFLDAPYYFAPGAEPFHEVISQWQREFQTGLGRNHAKKFDAEGWLYYTKEFFDLLYPGYGDTYPTFSGSIGMTYEQAGHGQGGLGVINKEGDTLTLVDRITHHHTTGLSTVEYSVLNKDKLIQEYKTYTTSHNYNYKSYILWGEMEKLKPLLQLMDAHSVQYGFGKEQKVSGYSFATKGTGSITATGQHIIISTNQKKGALVKVLFEPKTKLSDSLTYDLTAWSLPYAYGINCLASEIVVEGKSEKPLQSIISNSPDAYAYLIRWKSMSGARVLTGLLKNDVRVRFAEKPFSFGNEQYEAGTLIVIPAENKGKNVSQLISDLCSKNSISYSTTTTGMVDTGKDFGSESVKKINQPKVGLLSEIGEPSNIGDIWYYFEQELNYPLSVIHGEHLNVQSLQNLDVLIVADGSWRMSDTVVNDWVNQGGKLIFMGPAIQNLSEDSPFALIAKHQSEPDSTKQYANAHIHYAENNREKAKNLIPGAIYKCDVDKTNPLAFGYDETYFTLKVGSDAYEWLPNGQNVVQLGGNGRPEAGFAGCETSEYQKNSLIFGVSKKGKGSVIYMIDNPLFRGFWENGKLFMANAVFFVYA